MTIFLAREEGRMEGGDYIPAGNISLIGCGMRTNDEGIRQMQMHLDTHFNIIDSNLCTMVRSRLQRSIVWVAVIPA